MQMVEQLVACQQEMQQHHAAALSFYQTMMTQEYGKLGQDDKQESLPLGWIRTWDNDGGNNHYFNTVNHDMQDGS
jgi:hypothetical protein